MARNTEAAREAHRRWYANLSPEKKEAYKRREAARIAEKRHSDDPEIVAYYKAVGKRYRTTHKEEIKARNKHYRECHREEKRAYDKLYRATHREYRNAYSRERRRKLKELKNEIGCL